jgi:TolB-like protein/Tfp pilus assembly protein PilF
VDSLAVLPLENLSRDPDQQYFVDGMHEAITGELARIRALKVISRTSVMRYQGTNKSAPEIARELGVDAVVEGSVLFADGRVRITVQLIDGTSDRHLLAESYERDMSHVLSLQDTVARAIAERIQVTLTPAEQTRLATHRVVNPEAYRLYLVGNFQLGKQSETGFRQALQHYRQAVDIDPGYAPAYAGQAMAYIELGSWASSLPPGAVHAQARAAAQQALERDSTLAEGHIAIARIKQLFEWDWAGAEAAYRKGIALNPGSSHALLTYGNYLMSMGRFEEAAAINRRAVELDPLSPHGYNELGWALDHLWRDAEALDQYKKALDLAPDLPNVHLVLAEFQIDRGRFDDAARHARVADSLLGGAGSPAWMARLGYIHARTNRRADALRILNELRTRSEREYVPPSALASVHIGLGQNEEALELLELAYERRDVVLVWLKVRRYFDPLRDDPRFQELLRRMNFPA